jgi:glycosyltransferase involved in cell wall biosynthesis
MVERGLGHATPIVDCLGFHNATKLGGNRLVKARAGEALDPLNELGDPNVRHVFFDVTNLRVYLDKGRRLSGIQRVTVMLIEYTARQIGSKNVFLSFHDDKTDAYHVVPYTEINELGGVLSTEALTAGLYRKQPVHVRPTLERYARNPVKRAVHAAIRNLNAALGNHRHFEKRNSTLQAWQASAKPSEALKASPHAGELFQDFFKVAQGGDRLILADAAWSVPLTHMKTAHSQGISCHFLIHDLIQIKAPELIAGMEQSLVFHDWLLETSRFVDSYLANSEATERDLREFLQAYGAEQRIDVVPLATAGIPVLPDQGSKQASITQINENLYPKLAQAAHIDDKICGLLKRPYILCVGTMEARKNMWGLAQAWDRLRHQDDIELPKLVFAGNRGWLNQDFENMMEATGNLYGWIELVPSPSDQELDFLYRNCLFTAMPSFFEGWGLPVGESLSYGKTAIVSETSSLPEVGGDLVLYFDPHSIASITAAVYRMLSEEGLRESFETQISKTTLRGWEDVCQDILEAIQ